jgi:hypothetical protein
MHHDGPVSVGEPRCHRGTLAQLFEAVGEVAAGGGLDGQGCIGSDSQQVRKAEEILPDLGMRIPALDNGDGPTGLAECLEAPLCGCHTAATLACNRLPEPLPGRPDSVQGAVGGEF